MANHKGNPAVVSGIRYKSGLEAAAARQLEEAGIPFEYEPSDDTIYTSIPVLYTPDFSYRARATRKRIVIETKGYFPAPDRRKFLSAFNAARARGIDLRLVLQTPGRTLQKGAKTNYGQWATKHGIPWAKAERGKPIPEEWLNE